MSDHDFKTEAEMIDWMHDQSMRENRRRVMALSELTEEQKTWLLEIWWAPRAATQRAAHHARAVIRRFGAKCDLRPRR